MLTAWVAAGLCFILAFAISVMGLMVWQAVRLSQNADGLKVVATETHDALCAFKADLVTRKTNTEKFVADINAGRRPPINGISNADLERSVANQQSTLAALSDLDCD